MSTAAEPTAEEGRRGCGFTALGVAVALLAVMIAIQTYVSQPLEVDPEVLAERCRAARPVWPSYEEDIKGQIGAGPVALWRGVLREVELSGALLRVTMRVSAPWSGYSCGMPILLRTPSGGILLPETVIAGADTAYEFRIAPGEHASVPPWIELRYPHHQQRILLDSTGRWQGTD